jgi:hypothetical protein
MYVVDARHKGTSQTIYELLRDRKSIQVTSYLFFSFQGVAGLCKVTVAYSAPTLSQINRFNVTPNTLSLYSSSSLRQLITHSPILIILLTKTTIILVSRYLPAVRFPVPLSCSCCTRDVPQGLGHCCTVDSQVAVQVQDNAQREAEPSNLKQVTKTFL